MSSFLPHLILLWEALRWLFLPILKIRPGKGREGSVPPAVKDSVGETEPKALTGVGNRITGSHEKTEALTTSVIASCFVLSAILK